MSFGRLERTPASQPMSDINVTPLVDVMLVLVVIFILTAPLMVNDRPLDAAALAQALEKTAQDNPNTEVQLKADTAVPYGRVVEFMGLAHRVGLTRIGFVADPGSAPAP